MPLLKFTVTMKRGTETVARVEGYPVPVDAEASAALVLETERSIERLTGLRTHIEATEAADAEIDQQVR